MTNENLKKIKVCFYGLYTYPIFNPKYPGTFGGWEIRMAMIAKELAKGGLFDVTILVADYGQPHIELREGVRLLSWHGRLGRVPAKALAENPSGQFPPNSNGNGQPGLSSKARLKKLYVNFWDIVGGKIISLKVKVVLAYIARGLIGVLRSFWDSLRILLDAPRLWRKIFAVLDKSGHFVIWREDIDLLADVDADIYVVFGNHHMSAAVAKYCSVAKKKYVFSAGSEYDYYPEFKNNDQARDIYGEAYFEKVYAIEKADLHIVQTPRQAEMLLHGYGRESIVVRNPIDLSNAFPRPEKIKGILWVGKSHEQIKRPSLLFRLARLMPEHPFVVVMNKAIPEVHEKCLKEAESLGNVTLIESVAYEDIESRFASARLFVNTSIFEGFPNTFLQAAKYGVPIVATDIDPCGMLSEHACGFTCGGDFDLFVQNVRRLMEDEDLYSRASSNAIEYVRAYHDKNITVDQYSNALKGVLG